MSKLQKTPGVYIDEISNLPLSIVSVETAIPAFIGYTQKAQRLEIGDLLFTPTLISSLQEFDFYFGSKVNETINIFLTDEFIKTGTDATLNSRTMELKIPYIKNNMYYHLQSFFANGGGRCYIVSTGKPKQVPTKKDLQKGLDEVYQYADPTLLVFPDGIHLPRATDLYNLYNEALMQAQELGDRFVIMDISEKELLGKSAIEMFRENISTGNYQSSMKFGAAYYPLLHSTFTYNYNDNSVRITHHTVIKEQGYPDRNSKGAFDQLYLNNPKLSGSDVYNEIKTEIEKHTVILSPSSAIAGIYASVDHTRGVWKAPANIALENVNFPTVSINDSEQALLKIDPVNGKSVNAIRYFSGKGTLIWGARSLAGNDNEWRYISTRRFFNMVEASVKKVISQYIFEPNDSKTWQQICTLIENYLTGLWKAGALAGAKPEHAFYVKTGLGHTMNNEDILEGRLIIETGMAMYKPAEFIVFRLIQQMNKL